MNDKRPGLDERSVVVNQLIAQFMGRTDAGETLHPAQFVAEHPEYADELKRHFANVRLLDGFKETGTPELDETLAKPASEAEISTESATANTLLRGTADSETSVTRDHKTQNTGSATNIDIPESFGRYAIKKVLGQGAMGAVYLAKDTQLDRDVALKIPKFSDGSGVDREELLARFYREARAAATLRSPNICPVYDVGEIDGQHYITMAYIEGRPLKDFTKSKKSHSEKQIITTIRKLALGLAEAHSIGVIHRDLKPANIMVDLKGEPVVMDFGLARRSASDDVQVTQSGAILGTPAYMAPEQVAGDQAAIDHRVDIYALGIIMYELITGEMPFKGNLMAILQQIALNNPKKPSELRKDIDPRLETICLKMMAGDQTKRYQSMNDVVADLQDVLRNPGKRQKKEQAKKTGPKPTSIPSANEESNPALISIEQPKSYTEQLREKKSKTAKKPKSASKSDSKSKSSSKSGSTGPPKNLLIAGGLGGLLLLLGIIFLVRVGNYDVQITLDDPSITLSVDGETLKINDGQEVIKLTAGEHKLQLQKDGLKTHVEEFTVTKDGKTALMAKVVNGKLEVTRDGETAPVSNNQRDHLSPNEVNPPSSKPTRREAFALSFDGVDDYVEIPELTFDADQPFTVEAYVKLSPEKPIPPDDQQENWDPLFSTNGVFDPDAESFSLIYDRPRPTWWAGQKDARLNKMRSVGQTPSGRPGAYQHVAAVFDGKSLSLYLDGTLLNKIEQPNLDIKSPHQENVEPTSPTIGWAYYRVLGKERHFCGEIRQFRISTTARYSAEFKPDSNFESDTKTMVLYRFEKETGNVLKDSSGNGHHGKIIGAKWVQVDSRSITASHQALNFDGENDYVLLSDVKIDGESPITIEAWVTPKSLPKDNKPFGIVSDVQYGGIGLMAMGNQTWGFSVNDNSHTNSWGYSSARSEDLIQVDQSVHLAGTYNQREIKLFVNGKLKHQAEINGESFVPSKFPLFIGADPEDGDTAQHSFHGTIDEVRISTIDRYSSDFTVSDADHRLLNDVHTLAVYHFDEGTGDELKDSSGNNNHGKIVGAKWVRTDGSPITSTPPVGSAPLRAIAPFDVKQARSHQQAWARHLGVPVEYTNSIGMKFVLIPPGEFTMGSTPAEIEAALKIAGEEKDWLELIKSESPTAQGHPHATEIPWRP